MTKRGMSKVSLRIRNENVYGKKCESFHSIRKLARNANEWKHKKRIGSIRSNDVDNVDKMI